MKWQMAERKRIKNIQQMKSKEKYWTFGQKKENPLVSKTDIIVKLLFAIGIGMWLTY